MLCRISLFNTVCICDICRINALQSGGCRGTSSRPVWMTFHGPLLLLSNNKPVSSFTVDEFIEPLKPANATIMPMDGAGIWAVHTTMWLGATATITANNQSAVYLDSGTARFAAVRMLNNRANSAVLLFVNSSSSFAGTFDCSQNANPTDLAPYSRVQSTTCVLADNSSLRFNAPAIFAGNVQNGSVVAVATKLAEYPAGAYGFRQQVAAPTWEKQRPVCPLCMAH